METEYFSIFNIDHILITHLACVYVTHSCCVQQKQNNEVNSRPHTSADGERWQKMSWVCLSVVMQSPVPVSWLVSVHKYEPEQWGEKCREKSLPCLGCWQSNALKHYFVVLITCWLIPFLVCHFFLSFYCCTIKGKLDFLIWFAKKPRKKC